MTYLQLMNQGIKKAKKLKKEVEAIKILTLELSKKDGASFLAGIKDEVPSTLEQTIKDAYDAYFSGMAPQHIIGYSYFYGYKMIVNKDVLIPRCETEELIGFILSYYDSMFEGLYVDVVDVGTGSGNIAIALKKEEPKMNMYATDISNDALSVAKQNAINNECSINFLSGNMLEPLINNNLKFDILVSNPPYIPDDEYVENIVFDNEPHIALFGGSDGMKFYETIFENSKYVLKEKALMAFEHSHKTKDLMIALAKKYYPNAYVEDIKDLQGKDRFLIVQIGVDNE